MAGWRGMGIAGGGTYSVGRAAATATHIAAHIAAPIACLGECLQPATGRGRPHAF